MLSKTQLGVLRVMALPGGHIVGSYGDWYLRPGERHLRFATWLRLERGGYIEQNSGYIQSGRSTYYTITERGRTALQESSE